MTTDERDRLLAEKARIEAELAKLDAPDPLLIEAREICADHWERRGIFHFAAKIRERVCDDNSDVDSALAALRRGMELAAAPLTPRDAGMSEEEIEALARECCAKDYEGKNLAEAARNYRTGEYQAADDTELRIAIFATSKPDRITPGRIEPVELPDDGLRVHYQGQACGFPMVCLHNPALIAQVAAAKALRRTIRAANERAFG